MRQSRIGVSLIQFVCILLLCLRALGFRLTEPLCLIVALVDHFEMGLLGGYRGGEWANPSGVTDPRFPTLNHMRNAIIRTRALCPRDFTFLTFPGRTYVGLDVLQVPVTAIHKNYVLFRTQKNGDHGDKRLFTLNPNSKGLCHVRSVYRCLQRFHALMKLDPSLTDAAPLSCYWDRSSQRARLVTTTDIELFIRSIAAEAYGLHPRNDKESLQRWSSHSLRVGACVALHSMGFTSVDIQWLLRWRSQAFMAYLRNLCILADKQHKALDQLAGMPHLE